MGKVKRQRQKLHLSTPKETEIETESLNYTETYHPSPLLRIEDDVFKDINFNVDGLLTTKLEDDDDRRSVKSFKSVKSELTDGTNKIIPKKYKLKLRRELFLKKIDNAHQLRDKRKNKNIKIIENANMLDDALLSLKDLLPSSAVVKEGNVLRKKPKGIQKAKIRRKEMVKEINIFKKALSNKQFKANSLAAISEHIKAVCQNK